MFLFLEGGIDAHTEGWIGVGGCQRGSGDNPGSCKLLQANLSCFLPTVASLLLAFSAFQLLRVYFLHFCKNCPSCYLLLHNPGAASVVRDALRKFCFSVLG